MANVNRQAAAAVLAEKRAAKGGGTLGAIGPAALDQPDGNPAPQEPVLDRAGEAPVIVDAPLAAPAEKAPTPLPTTPKVVSEAAAAAAVAAAGELDWHVFSDVDPDVRGHLRDAVQSVRLGMAAARAKGVFPDRILSMVVAVDVNLVGRAHIFAGDRTK